jgi:hypothetical protein
MNKTVHYIGLDVHKESIAMSIVELPPPRCRGVATVDRLPLRNSCEFVKFA